jgi:hypothetical protein
VGSLLSENYIWVLGGFLFFREGGFFITWWERKGGCETMGFLFLFFCVNFHNLVRIKNEGVKCKKGFL